MPQIILITGLPCSGKTHYAREINTAKNYTIIDDPFDLEKDVYPIVDEIFTDNIETKGIIITDPNLVYINNRIALELIFFKRYNFKDLEWIFFENDPENCLKNYECRKQKGDFRNVREKILSDSNHYIMPKKTILTKIIPVWRPQ